MERLITRWLKEGALAPFYRLQGCTNVCRIMDYPNSVEAKKFSTEAAARQHLSLFSIHDPRCFWVAEYETGTLMASPKGAINRVFCFPVGLPSALYKNNGHGEIVDAFIKADMWMWKVRMRNGFEDVMAEWPLLCGLKEAVACGLSPRSASEISSPQIPAASSRIDASAGVTWPTTSGSRPGKTSVSRRDGLPARSMFAVRGSEVGNGVFGSIEEAIRRVKGEVAEMKEFTDKAEAWIWIRAGCYYVVQTRRPSVMLVLKKNIVKVTQVHPGSVIDGPFSSSDAYVHAEYCRRRVEEKISSTTICSFRGLERSSLSVVRRSASA